LKSVALTIWELLAFISIIIIIINIVHSIHYTVEHLKPTTAAAAHHHHHHCSQHSLHSGASQTYNSISIT